MRGRQLLSLGLLFVGLVGCAIGCGGTPTQAAFVPTGQPGYVDVGVGEAQEPEPFLQGGRAPAPTALEATPQQICSRLMQLQAEKCGPFGTRITMQPATCVGQFSRPDADEGERSTREGLVSCVMQPNCSAVGACFAELHAPGKRPLRACTDSASGMAPVGVPPSEYARRNGSSAKRFSDVKSSPTQPIERCGIPDANRWLTTLSCANGDRPIEDDAGAEDHRIGNIGANGRCGSIVDHYRAVCKEGATDIYIDAYVCPTE